MLPLVVQTSLEMVHKTHNWVKLLHLCLIDSDLLKVSNLKVPRQPAACLLNAEIKWLWSFACYLSHLL